MLTSFKKFVLAHKVTTVIVLIVILGGGYYWYSGSHGKGTVTTYVIENATQGTIVSSVSATGQVNPVTTIDVKPQVTENVTKIYVQPGDVVTAGEPLVQLDTTNEDKALTEAQISYQSSQLALAKLQEVATTTLLGDQDSLSKAQEDVANASTSLAQDYQNGFDSLGSAFVDLQSVMMGLQDIVTGNDIGKTQTNPDAYVSLMPNYLQGSTQPYANTLLADYNTAVTAYQQTLSDYHATNRNAPPATLDALFAETYQTVQDVANTIKDGKDLINFVVNNYPKTGASSPNLPAVTNTFQTDLGNYTNTVSGDASSISGVTTNIQNDEDAITQDQQSLEEASATLASLVSGPDPLDVQSQQLSIESSQLSLQTAQQNLAYDTITSPINGVVSAVDAVVGESVPSPAVSVVGQGDIAEVTLNEIDAAKVAVGDPATLTFDALPTVSLAGQVVELDPVGTVSQGVVNYNVQVSFTDTATSTDLQVKPGMSVTTNIVTQVAQNVIAVPNAAVVTSGGTSYILEPSTPVSSSTLAASASGGVQLSVAPKRVPVTIGLANDTMTEITFGVNVGDQIITQTITTAATTASTATGGTSALRLLGGGAGAGGAAGGGFRGGGGAAGGGG